MMRWLYRSAKDPAEGPDEDAGLVSMQELVGADTVDAFAGSSELPSGAAAAAEVSALLLRYLRAEKGDLDRATQRIAEQSAWRRNYGSVTEEDVVGELATGKVKVQLPAPSSQGRPLLIVKGRLHRPGGSLQAQQKFIFFCLETAAHYCWNGDNPDGKLVAVFDLGGLQVRNLDATALRASFTMLAQHFPERMVTVWMLDAPTIFYGIWKVVEPFIDSTARKNIRFVSGKEGREALVESLGAEIVPLEYGGSAAEVPVEHAARQLPAWQRRQRGADRGPQVGAQQGQAAAAEHEKQHNPRPGMHAACSSPTLASDA